MFSFFWILFQALMHKSPHWLTGQVCVACSCFTLLCIHSKMAASALDSSCPHSDALLCVSRLPEATHTLNRRIQYPSWINMTIKPVTCKQPLVTVSQRFDFFSIQPFYAPAAERKWKILLIITTHSGLHSSGSAIVYHSSPSGRLELFALPSLQVISM